MTEDLSGGPGGAGLSYPPYLTHLTYPPYLPHLP
jgi:hypothetical protein